MQHRPPFKRNRRDSLLLPTGWLFADLLLALAMLFLVANTVKGSLPPVAAPTPTPVLIATATRTPTPVPILPSLDFNPVEFRVTNIDYVTLLSSRPQSVIEDIKKTVIAEPKLWGCHAALVLAFGDASTYDQVGEATQIAAEVYKVLQSLGEKQEIVVKPGVTVSFWKTRYYKYPLYDVGSALNLSTVEIVVYCFSR